MTTILLNLAIWAPIALIVIVLMIWGVFEDRKARRAK